MSSPVVISELVVTRASDADRAAGLEAYLRFVVDDRLIVNGAVLRRTLDGRRTTSWPSKHDRYGIVRFHVQPTKVARAEIEAAVLRAVDAQINGVRP